MAKVNKVSMQGGELEGVRNDFGIVQKLLDSAFKRHISQRKRPSRCGEMCPGIRVQFGGEVQQVVNQISESCPNEGTLDSLETPFKGLLNREKTVQFDPESAKLCPKQC